MMTPKQEAEEFVKLANSQLLARESDVQSLKENTSLLNMTERDRNLLIYCLTYVQAHIELART